MGIASLALVQTSTTPTNLGVTTAYADINVAPEFRRISGVVEADQAGTLNLQYKSSAGTYTTFQAVPVAAGVASVFDYPCPMATARISYTVGGTNEARHTHEIYLSREL